MIDLKLEGVEEAILLFDPKKVKMAAHRALKDAAKSGRVRGSELIRKDFNLKAGRVAKLLKMAVKTREGEEIIEGSTLGTKLSYFEAKQQDEGMKNWNIQGVNPKKVLVRKTGRRYGGAVSVKVKKTRKVVHREWGSKPFLAQVRTGHIGVFERVGKKRYPIKEKIGPGVGGVFGSRLVMPHVKERILEQWPKRFDAWLHREGWKKK